MPNASPVSGTSQLITAVQRFQLDRVKLARFAKNRRIASTGHRYRTAEQRRSRSWPHWWANVNDLAAASFQELRAAGVADHRVILELKDAVRYLHGVRVPPAFLHYDNESRAVDETEQNHPGIRQRLFQDALRAFDQADSRVSQAVAELQRLASLVTLTELSKQKPERHPPGEELQGFIFDAIQAAGGAARGKEIARHCGSTTAGIRHPLAWMVKHKRLKKVSGGYAKT